MKNALFVRSPYNYDVDKVSNETGLACMDKSRTQQSGKDDADINVIVRRFGIDGQMPTNVRVPQYGDFHGINDFHTAMNAVAEAHEAFDALPAAVRARFGNDTEAFVEFCSDDKNEAEMRELGLLKPKEVPVGVPPGDPGSAAVDKGAQQGGGEPPKGG